MPKNLVISDLVNQYGPEEQSNGLDFPDYDEAVAAMIRYEEQHGGLSPSLTSEPLPLPASTMEQPDAVKPAALPSTGREQRRIAIAGEPQPVSRSQVEKIGKRDPRSRRHVLQPSKSIVNNERLAAPELRNKLASLTRQLPGVELARVRPQKNPERVIGKVREGKPPDTISDYLAIEIAIDSPQAGEHMIDLLRRNFKVVDVDRQMSGRENKGGYASTNVQVQMANGLTAEVQLVPREVQGASRQSHHYYVQGREARDAGNKVGARVNFSKAEKINKRALRKFQERNGSE